MTINLAFAFVMVWLFCGGLAMGMVGKPDRPLTSNERIGLAIVAAVGGPFILGVAIGGRFQK